jgi:hypothetical protein
MFDAVAKSYRKIFSRHPFYLAQNFDSKRKSASKIPPKPILPPIPKGRIELIDQIALVAVNFDPVHPDSSDHLSRPAESLNQLLNFVGGQLPAGNLGPKKGRIRGGGNRLESGVNDIAPGYSSRARG